VKAFLNLPFFQRRRELDTLSKEGSKPRMCCVYLKVERTARKKSKNVHHLQLFGP
jgi:hypothetical protein